MDVFLKRFLSCDVGLFSVKMVPNCYHYGSILRVGPVIHNNGQVTFLVNDDDDNDDGGIL